MINSRKLGIALFLMTSTITMLAFQNFRKIPVNNAIATSSTVTLSGYVTLADGSPLSGAPVRMIDWFNGDLLQSTITNSSGYYTFSGVPSESDATIKVLSKRHLFRPVTLTFHGNGNIDNIDFQASTERCLTREDGHTLIFNVPQASCNLATVTPQFLDSLQYVEVERDCHWYGYDSGTHDINSAKTAWWGEYGCAVEWTKICSLCR